MKNLLRRGMLAVLLAVVGACGGSSGALPDLNDVTWGNGRFVAVGLQGRILTSPDGTAWTARNPGDGVESLTAVLHFEGRFLAAGAAGVTTSSVDGEAWEPGSTGSSADILGLAHGSGVGVVAVGRGGAILHSSAGLVWEPQSSPVDGESWFDVAFGEDRFVAVGDRGTVIESADGKTWEIAFQTDQPLYGVTWAAGRFLGGGNAGTIVTREVGGEWSRESIFSAQPVIGLGFGRGIFVMVGGSGIVYTTPPDFERITGAGVPAQVQLNAVVEANDTFVTVGREGAIFTSRDAVAWRNFSS